MSVSHRTCSIEKYVLAVSKNGSKSITFYKARDMLGVISFEQNPQEADSITQTQFFLHYDPDSFQSIIEMLRYEKPAYVQMHWDEKGIKSSSVYTGQELVGEQE